MFRKSRTTINGVELPEEFSGASIINNVVISSDGKKYAHITKEGALITGNMPSDGVLEIDGTTITYRKGSGISVQGGRGAYISGGSVVSVGAFSTGRDLEYEIDENYDGVKECILKNSVGDISLGLRNDDKTQVKGKTSSKPTYEQCQLSIQGLEGSILLPQMNESLMFDVKTNVGDVTGQVAHKGRIHTSTGDIGLRIYAPLILEVRTSIGDIDVYNMERKNKNVYVPKHGTPRGTLTLETSTGDIVAHYWA